MKISPKYEVSHFIKANEEKDWLELVKIFSDRLEGRYLKPVELILNGDSKISEFSGFSILALDCILIETLNQFYNGKNNTDDKPCDVTPIKNSFINFLTTSISFCNDFDKSKASTFYYHFRNGLLHQAQTKNKSLIKIGQPKMVTKIEGGLIIDRILFHQAIVDEINNYKSQLISGEDNKVKRENFITKMKFICGCE